MIDLASLYLGAFLGVAGTIFLQYLAALDHQKREVVQVATQAKPKVKASDLEPLDTSEASKVSSPPDDFDVKDMRRRLERLTQEISDVKLLVQKSPALKKTELIREVTTAAITGGVIGGIAYRKKLTPEQVIDRRLELTTRCQQLAEIILTPTSPDSIPRPNNEPVFKDVWQYSGWKHTKRP